MSGLKLYPHYISAFYEVHRVVATVNRGHRKGGDRAEGVAGNEVRFVFLPELLSTVDIERHVSPDAWIAYGSRVGSTDEIDCHWSKCISGGGIIVVSDS